MPLPCSCTVPAPLKPTDPSTPRDEQASATPVKSHVGMSRSQSGESWSGREASFSFLCESWREIGVVTWT